MKMWVLLIPLCLHLLGTQGLFAPSPSSVIVATISRLDTATLDDAWVPVTLQELAFNGNSGWPTVSSLQLDDARCASGEPCFARNRCPYDGYGAPRLSPDGATLALGGEFTRTAATLSEAVSAQRVVVEVSARGVVTVFNFSGACEATGQVRKTCGTSPTTTIFSAQSVGASGWALACREMFQGNRFVSRNDFSVTRMDDGDRNYAVLATSALSSPRLSFFSLFLAAASASKGYGVFNLGNASSIGSRAPPYAAYLTGTDVSTTQPVCSNSWRAQRRLGGEHWAGVGLRSILGVRQLPCLRRPAVCAGLLRRSLGKGNRCQRALPNEHPLQLTYWALGGQRGCTVCHHLFGRAPGDLLAHPSPHRL